MNVVVTIPKTTQKLPVLIAFHGLGEARKGPERGARGWVDDYKLPRALARLAAPPLVHDDWEKLGDASRLARINESLERRPYRGLIVVTPYTPDIIAPDRSLDAGRDLARFVIDELLPRVRKETPAGEAIGIDGVSLGGRAALLVGLERASWFTALGTLQPAIYDKDLRTLTTRAAAAREQNPRLALRLLTSRKDFYVDTIQRLSRSWKRAGVEHRLDVVSGPHSYAFNRGPGVYEMLLFHDRVLRGERYLQSEGVKATR